MKKEDRNTTPELGTALTPFYISYCFDSFLQKLYEGAAAWSNALVQGHTKILSSSQDLNPLTDVYYTCIVSNSVVKKKNNTHFWRKRNLHGPLIYHQLFIFPRMP